MAALASIHAAQGLLSSAREVFGVIWSSFIAYLTIS
jgi:hypothetical protein